MFRVNLKMRIFIRLFRTWKLKDIPRPLYYHRLIIVAPRKYYKFTISIFRSKKCFYYLYTCVVSWLTILEWLKSKVCEKVCARSWCRLFNIRELNCWVTSFSVIISCSRWAHRNSCSRCSACSRRSSHTSSSTSGSAAGSLNRYQHQH